MPICFQHHKENKLCISRQRPLFAKDKDNQMNQLYQSLVKQGFEFEEYNEVVSYTQINMKLWQYDQIKYSPYYRTVKLPLIKNSYIVVKGELISMSCKEVFIFTYQYSLCMQKKSKNICFLSNPQSIEQGLKQVCKAAFKKYGQTRIYETLECMIPIVQNYYYTKFNTFIVQFDTQCFEECQIDNDQEFENAKQNFYRWRWNQEFETQLKEQLSGLCKDVKQFYGINSAQYDINSALYSTCQKGDECVLEMLILMLTSQQRSIFIQNSEIKTEQQCENLQKTLTIVLTKAKIINCFMFKKVKMKLLSLKTKEFKSLLQIQQQCRNINDLLLQMNELHMQYSHLQYRLQQTSEYMFNFLNCPLSQLQQLSDLKVMNSDDYIENQINTIYAVFIKNNYRQQQQQYFLCEQLLQISQQINKQIIINVFNTCRKTNIQQSFLEDISTSQFIKQFFVEFMKKEICKKLSEQMLNKFELTVDVLNIYLYFDKVKQQLSPKKFKVLINYEVGQPILRTVITESLSKSMTLSFPDFDNSIILDLDVECLQNQQTSIKDNVSNNILHLYVQQQQNFQGTKINQQVKEYYSVLNNIQKEIQQKAFSEYKKILFKKPASPFWSNIHENILKICEIIGGELGRQRILESQFTDNVVIEQIINKTQCDVIEARTALQLLCCGYIPVVYDIESENVTTSFKNKPIKILSRPGLVYCGQLLGNMCVVGIDIGDKLCQFIKQQHGQFTYKATHTTGNVGMTALMMAACEGNTQIVKILKSVEMKTQSQQQDKKGYTALMYAVEQEQIECVELLLDETGIKNDQGDTALIIAVQNRNEQLIKLLSPYEKTIQNKSKQEPFELIQITGLNPYFSQFLITPQSMLVEQFIIDVFINYDSSSTQDEIIFKPITNEKYSVTNIYMQQQDEECIVRQIAILHVIDEQNIEHICKVTKIKNGELKRYEEIDIQSWASLPPHPNIMSNQSFYKFDAEYNCYTFSIMKIGEPISTQPFKSLKQISEVTYQHQMIIETKEEFKKFTLDLCEGLIYLHETKKIIHRDIKPDNVVFDYEIQKYQIIDYETGIKVNDIDQQILSSCKKITLGYAAPEIVNGFQYNYTCDLYSLGKTLYEVVQGIPEVDQNQFQGVIQQLTARNLTERIELQEIIRIINEME